MHRLSIGAYSLGRPSGLSEAVSYRAGRVVDVLPVLTGTFDLIHDDAWFASAPEHLESMIGLLRPGGVLTAANWFLLVEALTGTDLSVNWITKPPLGIATQHSGRTVERSGLSR